MYCRAVLPSAGLGNKLFPWARCRVFSLEHRVEMLAPSWTQLRPGPFLRRDRDNRVYHNLFTSSPPDYVTGVRRLLLRMLASRELPEPDDLHSPPTVPGNRAGVVFCTARDHFRALTGWHTVLMHELRTLTRERWLRRADAGGPLVIGIHVRRGDFARPTSDDDFRLRGGLRTPLDWFVRCLERARDICEYPVPAAVVSDARDDALESLLAQYAVRRVDTGSAISDLLVLSTARLLIASGGSSFGAWASFFGQMPSVAYPGQSLAWFNIAPCRGQYIGEWNHEEHTPDDLLDQLRELRRQFIPV
jgi:hypothetical protein